MPAWGGGAGVGDWGPPSAAETWAGSGPGFCLCAAAAPSPACDEASGVGRGRSCPCSGCTGPALGGEQGGVGGVCCPPLPFLPHRLQAWQWAQPGPGMSSPAPSPSFLHGACSLCWGCSSPQTSSGLAPGGAAAAPACPCLQRAHQEGTGCFVLGDKGQEGEKSPPGTIS